MKAIISSEFAQALEPQLPADVQIVRVDREGNFDGVASDAEVYLSASLLKSAVLDCILNAAPAVRWQHTPSAGVNHLLDLFLDNLHRYQTGQPLRNIVDRHAGY